PYLPADVDSSCGAILSVDPGYFIADTSGVMSSGIFQINEPTCLARHITLYPACTGNNHCVPVLRHQYCTVDHTGSYFL
ncbi:hypothetical protein Q7O44_11275, partial [Shigella flexneri]|nr:hypothetical protein [Shigella flexneri]